MLGAPEELGLVGALLVAAGFGVAVLGAWLWWRRRRGALRALGVVGAAAVAAVVVAIASAPRSVWRMTEDLRYTRSLGEHERRGAGPIQAFLQPYLLDDAARALPADASYFAVAGDAVPYPTAREAFRGLALNVLFPRVARDRPADADWIVAWGADPADVADVVDARVVTPRSGRYPPVVLARVARRSP